MYEWLSIAVNVGNKAVILLYIVSLEDLVMFAFYMKAGKHSQRAKHKLSGLYGYKSLPVCNI